MPKASKRERQKENRERAREERERMMKRDRRNKTIRGFLIVLVPVIIVLVIIQLVRGGGDDDGSTASAGSAVGTPEKCSKVVPKQTEKDTEQSEPKMTIDPAKTYTATIGTSCGTITATLDAKSAPIATNNFVALANQGLYDGLKWHRAAKDFVIQGGDPAGDGSGGPGYEVKGEVPKDNYPEGSLAAAKSGSALAGSFGSQFFIVTGTQGATLPNDYARFGSVTKGLDVAQKIESFAPTTGDGAPTQPAYIVKVTIKEG